MTINGAKAMQCVIEFDCFGLAADGLVEDYSHNLLLLESFYCIRM